MGLAVTEDNRAGEHVRVDSYSGKVNSDSGGSEVNDGDTGGPRPPDTAPESDNSQGGGLRSSGLENARWSNNNDWPFTVSSSNRVLGSVVAKVCNTMGDLGVYPGLVDINSGGSEGEANTGGLPAGCYVPQDTKGMDEVGYSGLSST